nr:uncharacterized protein LOC127303711 [Lolium perenne]
MSRSWSAARVGLFAFRGGCWNRARTAASSGDGAGTAASSGDGAGTAASSGVGYRSPAISTLSRHIAPYRHFPSLAAHFSTLPKDFNPSRRFISPSHRRYSLPAMAPTCPKKMAKKSSTKPLGKEAVMKGPKAPFAKPRKAPTSKTKPDDWTEERWQEDCLRCKLSMAERGGVVEQEKKTVASLAQQKAALATCVATTYRSTSTSAYIPGVASPSTPCFFGEAASATPGLRRGQRCLHWGPLEFEGASAPFGEEAAREEEDGEDEEEEDDEEDGNEQDDEEDAAEDAEDLVEVDAAGVRKKKKKAASGSRGSKWKALEDQCLCESWATVSHDSVIGANQKYGKYWARIKA